MFDPGGVLHAALGVLCEGSGVPHSPPLGDLGGNKEISSSLQWSIYSFILANLEAHAVPAVGIRASRLHLLQK